MKNKYVLTLFILATFAIKIEAVAIEKNFQSPPGASSGSPWVRWHLRSSRATAAINV